METTIARTSLRRYAVTLIDETADNLLGVETITLVETADNPYDATYQAVIRAHRDFGWANKHINDVEIRTAV